jgi:hypothetical protein
MIFGDFCFRRDDVQRKEDGVPRAIVPLVF